MASGEPVIRAAWARAICSHSARVSLAVCHSVITRLRFSRSIGGSSAPGMLNLPEKNTKSFEVVTFNWPGRLEREKATNLSGRLWRIDNQIADRAAHGTGRGVTPNRRW